MKRSRTCPQSGQSFFGRAFGAVAEQFLKFAEGKFNPIEIGRVGRQVADFGAHPFDGVHHATRLVARSQLTRIIKKAGLKPWRKLFQNLRASRSTDFARISGPSPKESGYGTRRKWREDIM